MKNLLLVKKMHYDVDKSSDYNPKSVQLYVSIHEYFEAGYSYRAISKLLHCSRNDVKLLQAIYKINFVRIVMYYL